MSDCEHEMAGLTPNINFCRVCGKSEREIIDEEDVGDIFLS